METTYIFDNEYNRKFEWYQIGTNEVKLLNRRIKKERECWAGCDIALDALQGFDKNSIKNLVLHVYFKCDNEQYYQGIHLEYYYKHYDHCFGTNKLITIGHGNKNKWKFKVKVEITESCPTLYAIHLRKWYSNVYKSWNKPALQIPDEIVGMIFIDICDLWINHYAIIL